MYIISAFIAFLLSCPANIPQLLVTVIATITMVGYHFRVNNSEITLNKKHIIQIQR